MQAQRIKSSTNNVFHYFEYRQLEQFQNGYFDGIINFGDDKIAVKVNHNSYSTIRIETTSTYLYIPVSFESVYGKVEKFCYLSPGHIITVETQNNDPYTNKLVVYWDVEQHGKSEFIDVGNKIVSIAAHDGIIAVSVENVGILLYELTDVVKLIAKIQCKGGMIKIHRDYIINYVDHIVTIMDIRIVSRKEFFDNLGDPIVVDTKYRWNAVDIDVEVYGEKHITHAMTLMQERMLGLETIVFIPQRTEEMEEGVRVVLGSQTKLEVYFIAYNNSDLKITLISSFNFNQTHGDNKGKIVATPCHVLRVHQESGMSVIDIYPLRKYFSNQYEADMGKINEFRVGDTTTDLPCMSKIHLPGITELVVINHKVVVVRSMARDINETPDDHSFKEVFVMEPLIVRLCQEIKNDMLRTVDQLKMNQDTCAIQSAISYKTYYELSVILEAYLSDIHHFIRRRNNNWTDLYWRDVLTDEGMVVKETLKELYSIIAEELLNSRKGELAAYYYSKANTTFSRVVDRFIICEVKSCINLYFDEIFFKSNKEVGAILMETEYDKVFRLLEGDSEKFIEITIQPAFQDHAKELNSLGELGKQKQLIKSMVSQKRKGTKEQEAGYFLETCCVYAEYVLMLREQPQEAAKIDIFKELNTRGNRSYEFEVIKKYKSILFDTRGNKTIKQPIVKIIEENRPLLLVALMEDDIDLARKYTDSNPTCEIIKLAAYEQIYKEYKRCGPQLLEMYLKLITNNLDYPMQKELDKKYKASFERNLNEVNTKVPEWIPKDLLTNIYVKKTISLLTHEDIERKIEPINSEFEFIQHFATRKPNCSEFINFLYAHYKNVIVGYVTELFNEQQALEKIAIEALKFEDELRDTIFDLVSTHLSIKCFCSIASRAPNIDLSPYLRKCIGNSFYNKHLIGLCDAFPKE